MEENKELYINPITFEAELFVHNLRHLSKTFNNLDELTICSLQKVMHTVQKFLDSNPIQISESENTELVKCENLELLRQTYTCKICEISFKGPDKIANHLANDCKLNSNKKFKEEEKPAVEERKLTISAVHYHTNIRNLLICDWNKFIANSVTCANELKYLRAYNKIIWDLLDLIKPLFPDQTVTVQNFGSRIVGVGNTNSDLDLYMDIGGIFRIFQTGMDDETLVKFKTVADALNAASHTWKGLVRIEKARVPILKIHHCPTGIECDINLSNGLGVINTQLLHYIFTMQPIAQILCIFLRKWFKESFLGEMNTYSINLMALFYLQILGLAPSVEQLQKNINEETALKTGHWLCSFDTLTQEQLNIKMKHVEKSNFVKLLTGFFSFYANFDLRKNLICPYFGRVMTKTFAFTIMPRRYKEKVGNDEEKNIRTFSYLAVQDPFELDINVTRNVRMVYNRFSMYAKLAFDFMKKHYGAAVDGDLSDAA